MRQAINGATGPSSVTANMTKHGPSGFISSSKVIEFPAHWSAVKSTEKKSRVGLFQSFAIATNCLAILILAPKSTMRWSASRSLIVICSPSAASSLWLEREISTFKSMGGAGRVFPLVVAGEPGASDKGRETKWECLPRSIRFEVAPGGVLTDRRTEPLAADARPNKDGWTGACLKLVAGILGVGFDDLRRRERARQHQLRIARAGVVLAASLFLVCAYVGLADADVKLPGGDAIRSRLDHFGFTVFRPVMSPDALANAAISLRSQLRRRLFAGITAGEMSGVGAEHDAWTIGQVTGSA
jgi:hypothetical protein